MNIKKTERGWAGHFICAMDCRFRRNTLIQYGKKYIVVSTVGAMFRMDEKGIQQIGADRYYETMSFWSDESDSIYHDISVSNEIYLPDTKWAIDKQELEENKDSIDNIANKMHDDYVAEIEKLLIGKQL